jgi:hypothetical protein
MYDARLFSTRASTFEKRREIGGKLARAYAAYARSFQEAISSCQDGNTGQILQRPAAVRPAVATVSTTIVRPGNAAPRMVNANAHSTDAWSEHTRWTFSPQPARNAKECRQW